MGFIYILENKINGKMYVGQTIQKINVRFSGHKYSKKRYNTPICSAISKYGWDTFNKYVFECDEEDLDYFERGFIKQMNTIAPCGYNLDGGGNKNKKRSSQSIEKTRKANIGKKRTKETIDKIKEAKRKNPYVMSDLQKTNLRIKMTGKNNHRYGKHWDLEHRIEHSKKVKGYKHTEEAKKKMRENRKDSHGENNSMYGKHHTEEHKKHLSDIMKEKWRR